MKAQLTLTERTKALELFKDTNLLIMLSQYATGARSIKEAGSRCGISYHKAYYLTRKLLQLELVTDQPSGKRKLYKAVASRLLVPPEASPFSSLEHMLLELGNFRSLCAYSANMLKERSERFNVILDVDVQDKAGASYYTYFVPETRTEEGENFQYSAPFFGLGDTWRISTEQAQELEDDLKALTRKYRRYAETCPERDAEEFYVQLGMVMVRPDMREENRRKEYNKAIQLEDQSHN